MNCPQASLVEFLRTQTYTFDNNTRILDIYCSAHRHKDTITADTTSVFRNHRFYKFQDDGLLASGLHGVKTLSVRLSVKATDSAELCGSQISYTCSVKQKQLWMLLF
ncbi:hypothetical protein CEXT_548671 [Caerostris extrusa]|uniref:Uncharacterized protein n=1 Tax=Caerostris extrusa TaxID=172846 RepID=A0AAV4P047_CAEEX|nr:hypothetical protein CEXT_548671 [Caerostris extrusa]